MKKKIFAAVLAGAMMLAVSGCNFSYSFNIGGRFSEKQAISVFEDTLDAEEFDTEDLIDACEDNDFDDDFEDGVWVKLDKSETKDLFKAMNASEFFPSVKGTNSAVAYLKTNDISEYDRYVEFICVMQLEDKDTADDFFDDTLDKWNDLSDDIDFDDDDLNEAYVHYESYGNELYLGIYRDQKQVALAICINETDELDDFCDEFDITSPSSLD